jgi:hypothetical protein
MYLYVRTNSEDRTLRYAVVFLLSIQMSMVF